MHLCVNESIEFCDTSLGEIGNHFHFGNFVHKFNLAVNWNGSHAISVQNEIYYYFFMLAVFKGAQNEKYNQKKPHNHLFGHTFPVFTDLNIIACFK